MRVEFSTASNYNNSSKSNLQKVNFASSDFSKLPEDVLKVLAKTESIEDCLEYTPRQIAPKAKALARKLNVLAKLFKNDNQIRIEGEAYRSGHFGIRIKPEEEVVLPNGNGKLNEYDKAIEWSVFSSKDELFRKIFQQVKYLQSALGLDV